MQQDMRARLLEMSSVNATIDCATNLWLGYCLVWFALDCSFAHIEVVLGVLLALPLTGGGFLLGQDTYLVVVNIAAA